MLDANIILRAVLGIRASNLIRTAPENIPFYAPEAAIHDAHRHLPAVAARRGLDARETVDLLVDIQQAIEVVDHASYSVHQHAAMARIAHRDTADWPIVATALLLNAPIWTEDQDFFGCGIATWVTATVHLYLDN